MGGGCYTRSWDWTTPLSRLKMLRMSRTLDLMARELGELRMKLAKIDSDRDGILRQIERLELATQEVARFEPYAVVRDGIPSRFAELGLASMTIAQGCEAILRMIGEPATSGQLLDILVSEGRFPERKQSSHISVIGALKRRGDLFKKVGTAWTLNAGEASEEERK